MQESVLTGWWWRATSYELRDGYLCPTRGAALKRYDPLDDHDYQRSTGSGSVPAYLSLAQIVDGDAAPAEREQRILEWCGTYGLLGLLLHQVQQVRFAPRWERRIPASPEARRATAALLGPHREWLAAMRAAGRGGRERRDSELRLTQAMYQRTSGGTYLWGVDQIAHPSVAPGTARQGEVADPRYWHLARPAVILQRLGTREWAQEPISETWARFFPDVPADEKATAAYPAPYSPEFWKAYAEPFQDFVSAAVLLRDALVAASERRLRGGRPRTTEVQRRGAYWLNALVAPVGPLLVGNRPRWEQRLVAPSLLGGLAVMAQLDLAGYRRIVRCANARCTKLFLGSSPRGRFCSKQCRTAQHARGVRAAVARNK